MANKEVKRELAGRKDNVLDDLESIVKSLKYICPTKECCEKIKSAFKSVKKKMSKRDPDNGGVNGALNEIRDKILEYPNVLKDAKGFNGEIITDKVLKSVLSHCGLKFGQTSRKKIGDKYEKYKMRTVCDHFQRLVHRCEKKFGKFEISGKGFESRIMKDWSNLEKEVLKLVGGNIEVGKVDFDELDAFGHKEAIANCIYRLSLDNGILRKAISKLALGLNNYSASSSDKYAVIGVPVSSGFWGWVYSNFVSDEWFSVVNSKKLSELSENVGKLVAELKDVYSVISKGFGSDKFDVSLMFYLRSLAFDLRMYVWKLSCVRKGKYIKKLRGSIEDNLIEIRGIVERMSNKGSSEKSNKDLNGEGNNIGKEETKFGGLTNRVGLLSTLVLELDKLKTIEIVGPWGKWFKEGKWYDTVRSKVLSLTKDFAQKIVS